MPIALWLGTREYSRIWRHGSAETFKVQEVMGTLVDGCTVSKKTVPQKVKFYLSGQLLLR